MVAQWARSTIRHLHIPSAPRALSRPPRLPPRLNPISFASALNPGPTDELSSLHTESPLSRPAHRRVLERHLSLHRRRFLRTAHSTLLRFAVRQMWTMLMVPWKLESGIATNPTSDGAGTSTTAADVSSMRNIFLDVGSFVSKVWDETKLSVVVHRWEVKVMLLGGKSYKRGRKSKELLVQLHFVFVVRAGRPRPETRTIRLIRASSLGVATATTLCAGWHPAPPPAC